MNDVWMMKECVCKKKKKGSLSCGIWVLRINKIWLFDYIQDLKKKRLRPLLDISLWNSLRIYHKHFSTFKYCSFTLSWSGSWWILNDILVGGNRRTPRKPTRTRSRSNRAFSQCRFFRITTNLPCVCVLPSHGHDQNFQQGWMGSVSIPSPSWQHTCLHLKAWFITFQLLGGWSEHQEKNLPRRHYKVPF